MQMSSGTTPCTEEVSPPLTTPRVLSRTSLCAVPVHDPAQASVRGSPVGSHCASRTAANASDGFAGLAMPRLLRSHVRLALWARPRLHDPIVQENPVEVMLARGLHDKSAALKAYITACLADALLAASGSDNNGTQIFVLLHIKEELEYANRTRRVSGLLVKLFCQLVRSDRNKAHHALSVPLLTTGTEIAAKGDVFAQALPFTASITACLADALLAASGSDSNGNKLVVPLHIREELE
eukprot:CAMPEP_0183485286 /NCGR_PEP_ID=MMETSP0370-20130417/179350_1 /TAXON_ID=268820 /ORGANISM="Peridinium aciculiferum, Strain PAER-2" /LENGTH=238 /DNA_ID=CAMNT_0025678589 /DNA_START=1208 /DNA_END=1924 /DNA_ORIENTATION=+